jgi:outer membrane biosynthesis protein TonB
MNSSILEEELAPLKSQIEKAGQIRKSLEGELHAVESELEKVSAERERFDALKEVCNALDRLAELNAEELFWKDFPEVSDSSDHVERLRVRAAGFEGEISGFLEKQASLKEQIDRCLDEIAFRNREVSEAYEREERRQEEFVIERETSPVPHREMIMPWTSEAESEKRLRDSVLVALLICLVFGGLIPLINVPIPDREDTVVEIPKRLVKLVKKEPQRSAVIPKPEPERKKKEAEKPKPKPEKKQKTDKKPKVVDPKPKQTKVAQSGKAAARKRAQNIGVMVFKDAFADLVKDTPVARLGSETRLSNAGGSVKGQAAAQRSLVALQAKAGTSGGIGNASVSRNIGNGNVSRLGNGGEAGITRVESAIAGLGESSRPLSDGLAPGRTDEEIQIVFDRYKAALYRIYNKELRKDPTLRGKILMRITIEPDGSVSMCKVESTDLASPELVKKIVERVRRFNFGPKEDVQRMTILYPIDFLPAG